MREFMKVTKALADPNRVRMLLALREQELCACQITELFGLAPSTMSKHLSILYQAGWSSRARTAAGFTTRCQAGKRRCSFARP